MPAISWSCYACCGCGSALRVFKSSRTPCTHMLKCFCRAHRDCQFSLNQTGSQILEAQLGVQGYWALCSQECKQQFLKNWLRLHFEVAAQRFGEACVLISRTSVLASSELLLPGLAAVLLSTIDCLAMREGRLKSGDGLHLLTGQDLFVPCTLAVLTLSLTIVGKGAAPQGVLLLWEGVNITAQLLTRMRCACAQQCHVCNGTDKPVVAGKFAGHLPVAAGVGNLQRSIS